MGNTIAPEVEGAKNLNRRGFLAGIGSALAVTVSGTASLAQEALAQEVTPVSDTIQDTFADIEYRESELGIDYRQLADFPMSHMLSQGEAEWMENATPVFGDETAKIWGHDMAVEIATGRVSKATVEDMREFTPKMLLSFARLDPNGKYMLIQTAGENFQLDQHLTDDQLAAL